MRAPQVLGTPEAYRFRTLARHVIYGGWCVRKLPWHWDLHAFSARPYR